MHTVQLCENVWREREREINSLLCIQDGPHTFCFLGNSHWTYPAATEAMKHSKCNVHTNSRWVKNMPRLSKSNHPLLSQWQQIVWYTQLFRKMYYLLHKQDFRIVSHCQYKGGHQKHSSTHVQRNGSLCMLTYCTLYVKIPMESTCTLYYVYTVAITCTILCVCVYSVHVYINKNIHTYIYIKCTIIFILITHNRWLMCTKYMYPSKSSDVTVVEA